MRELNTVLGQVPQMVREGDSAEAKLEAIWRIMGWHRAGLQTQVAGELADRWHTRNRGPRVPTDDPRKAAKRIEKMFSGETSLPMDFALLLVDTLPEPFRAAARVLVFPRASGGTASDLLEMLHQDQQHDQKTDNLRFLLATGQYEKMDADQLEAAALTFEDDSGSSKQLAAELRNMAASRRGAA
tara:strand:+ start:3816 stop:4370 length:555 start_codon:yes stop_codon:yes gene_type:complete